MSNVLLWLPTCYKYPFTRTACLKAVGPTVKSKEVGKGDKSGKKSRCKNSQFTFGDWQSTATKLRLVFDSLSKATL